MGCDSLFFRTRVFLAHLTSVELAVCSAEGSHSISIPGFEYQPNRWALALGCPSVPQSPRVYSKGHASWQEPVGRRHMCSEQCLAHGECSIHVIYCHWASSVKVWPLLVPRKSRVPPNPLWKTQPGQDRQSGRNWHCEKQEGTNFTPYSLPQPWRPLSWERKSGVLHPVRTPLSCSGQQPWAWNSAGHSTCTQPTPTEWTHSWAPSLEMPSVSRDRVQEPAAQTSSSRGDGPPVQGSLTLLYSITSEVKHGGNCRSEIAKEPLSP